MLRGETKRLAVGSFRLDKPGNWKLVVHGGDVLATAPDRASKLELYDLAADPHETRDVAAAHPERVAALRRHLSEFGRMQMKGVAPYAEGREGFKAPKDWIIK